MGEWAVSDWNPVGGLPQCGSTLGFDTFWAWLTHVFVWGD